MPEPLTPDIVRVAYKLFFCRPPENDAIVQWALGFGTLERLGEVFRNSVEFEFTLDRRPRLVSADAPPIDGVWLVDDATALALLARVRAAWQAAPPGLPADLGSHRDPSGEVQADGLLACVRRAGVDPATLADAFEFGCGSGRVLRHLAARFASAAGCDLSPPRLAAAAGAGALSPVADLRFGMAGPFDLWYSHLALQSFPPPLISRILQRALALLRPGGVAVFQLPTYAKGYGFSTDATPRADPALDRHMLPQPVVFAIAAAAGCLPAEAFDDLAVEPYPLWRSTVFVLRKPGG